MEVYEPEERIDVRVEVFPDHVLLAFPRKMEDHTTPWQNAMELGRVLEMAAGDVDGPPAEDPLTSAAGAAQVRLEVYKDRYVRLCFVWTDRIRLSKAAAVLLARRIRQTAQDVQYLKRRVRIRYDVPGRIGRPTPDWTYERRTFGRK